MTSKMHFFLLFASMAFMAVAEADFEWTDPVKDKLTEKGKPDAPLPTATVRLMPDQDATEEGPPVIIGMFDAENVTIHYKEGSIVLERPIGLRGSESKGLTFDSVRSEAFSTKRERAASMDGDDDGGYAPKHLPKHPAMPTKEEAAQRHVFGADERRVYRDTSFPYSAVGRVSSGCTGTMVGPRHVLTAAHCISSGSMTFTPAYYDGDAPFGTASVSRVVHWDVVDTSDGFFNSEVAFDYAVLILSSRLGDSTGWVGVRTYSASWNGGKYWDNFGYPGGLTGTQRPTYTLDGSIESVERYSLNSGGLGGMVLGHFIDSEGGHSGGPLWGNFGQESFPRIIGVQSSGATTPSFSTAGDNQAGGGQAMTDLVAYARRTYR